MESKGRCQVLTQPQVEPLEKQSRRQVGILGGNFNPVHNAHLIIADQVYHQLGLDKIYLMPSNESPHVDEKKTISANFRLDMLALALSDAEHLEIETIEIERTGKSYTYDTMKALTQQNPETDYYFIIGGDMVDYLPKWHRLEELLDLVQLVGVRRPNYPIESSYPIIWVDVPLMDLSSSYIRKKVAEGCSINYLLPQSVINYIHEKGLYVDEP
ncbi:nicotinate-nucleotide adenylyltransferase [uncultured Vagococcus sp.]|uniref:nicotinate-nucleotide adenylyltransferase n=1 Tax=uncultured Vagococcus sp. TaxID=189676 RepID=UPI0028D74E0C|nr:nicotinate-nucleotide adenylyltransferase [uncultured Vagococcus sp.]